MAFKFAARALLELGRELISSDEVALYELIKNAVDAKSPSIEIEVNIVVPHRAYAAAIDAIDEGASRTDVVDMLRNAIDSSAPKVSIDGFFAAMELATSGKRALRQALEEAYEKYNWIEVVDEGHGMSLAELNDVFLTVGTRSRRAENVKGAEYLGDKGVGRLSAMRLGDRLKVTTTRANDEWYSQLDIDWSQFSHDSSLDVSQIPISAHRGKRKSNRRLHGTTIRIDHISSDWSELRIQEMLSGRIARMVDPFEKGKGNRLLTPRFNGKHLLIPSIPEKLLASAHATCVAKFEFNKKHEPVFSGIMKYRLRNASRPIHQQGAELLSISQRVSHRRGKRGHAAVTAIPLRLKALKDLGPFQVEIYWFNRRVVEAVEGLTQKKIETQDEIAKWSGGPMLFRRGFRILPYGDPGDDWLELDKAAFGASGFKLNRQQVIGRVRVTAGHAALSEQTNREGLVQSDPRDALQILMMWLMHQEFRGLINDADEAHQLRVRQETLAKVDLGVAGVEFTAAFADLEKTAGPMSKPYVNRLRGLVANLTETCQTVILASERDAEAAQSEREKFVHLAGIGLMTEFIFHELDRAVQHTLRMLTERHGNHKVNLDALEEQLITLQKRVSAFDEFTGERRQTKTSFDVREAVRLVLENHHNQFARHHIKVNWTASQPFKLRAVKGMLVQILENLVANSVYWLKMQKTIEAGFKPELTIELDVSTKTLRVSDNGPGIDPSRKDVIFQPFISSKPPGQGRGLGLYISRDLAEYHGWQLEMDASPGPRPGRLNTFVLDMDQTHE